MVYEPEIRKFTNLLWDDEVCNPYQSLAFFIEKGKFMSNNYFKKYCPDYDSSYLGCNTGCPLNKCRFNKTIEKPLYKWSDGTLRTIKETGGLNK